MLWHFHKEMDVVGSVRQQGDIYIRKNGCCQTRGGKEVQKRVRTTVITSLPPHRRFSSVIVPDGGPGRHMKIIFMKKKIFATAANVARTGSVEMTRSGVSTLQGGSFRGKSRCRFFFPSQAESGIPPACTCRAEAFVN